MPKKSEGAMPPGGHPTTNDIPDGVTSWKRTGKSHFPGGGNNDRANEGKRPK